MHTNFPMLRILPLILFVTLIISTACVRRADDGGGDGSKEYPEVAHLIGDADFQTEVLDHQGVVLVDFTAHWCPPCRILSPRIDRLATEMSDRLKVVKVYEDEGNRANMKLIKGNGVTAYPTLIIFRNGEKIDTTKGLKEYDVLAKWVNGVLDKIDE